MLATYDDFVRHDGWPGLTEGRALFESEKFGENDARLANVLDNLAYFYGERGRYGEAMPYYLRALTGYRATVGEKHENFIGIERRIAYAYREQGAFQAALQHLNAAIAAARALHGADYVGIAYGYRESGDIRRMAGDESGAREDYRRGLAVAERGLGENHPVVVQLRRAIGQ